MFLSPLLHSPPLVHATIYTHKTVFDRFDVDQSGVLDKPEFQAMLKTFDTTLTEEQLEKAFVHFDADGNGMIDLAEFVQWGQGGAAAAPAFKSSPAV
jgi:Ca2+-binding EF-hand superfamily protein